MSSLLNWATPRFLFHFKRLSLSIKSYLSRKSFKKNKNHISATMYENSQKEVKVKISIPIRIFKPDVTKT